MAQIHGARLKYLRNGFTVLEMAEEFDKRLKYVGSDVYMWELTQRFWEMARIFGKWLRYMRHG